MSRREIIKKRFPLPDPIYHNYLVGMLLTRLIKSGEKKLAQNIVRDSLKIIKYRLNVNPIEIFEQAVKNVTPNVEVRPRRFGGATYQVPVKVKKIRGTNLALRWILKSAKKRSGKKIALKLANELIDASNNLGESIRKKQEVYRMAASNKAFAHIRS